MARSRLLAAALAACLVLPVAAAAAPACEVPPEILAEARPLPNAARALAAGGLSILAIGSASAVGNGSEAEAAWPARMQAALQERYPGRRIEVSVRGGRGVTATEHLALLRDGALGAQLVIWQVGTVEAARGLDVEDMSEAVVQGIERIHRAGADVVLMDQQFSRFLRANANIDPYREKLRMAASATGVPLLRRYDLMQGWAEGGGPDVERAPRADRAATMARVNDCLGVTLARIVARGITAAR
ncbi:SGNH/GDSL hydrolase family protein [Falsiroseomonas sp. HW251]|uniref:SGNH/GDSL hydrolase family protein n=1 Tax=Falsiroseomonas sp. HW251 TaxID=3390998 RepID=UPI003D31A1E9